MADEQSHIARVVLVLPLEPSYCEWCAMDGRQARCTHQVTVTHWYTKRGASTAVIACEKHAVQIATELRCRVKGIFP